MNESGDFAICKPLFTVIESRAIGFLPIAELRVIKYS
jgi:hypothetical protein